MSRHTLPPHPQYSPACAASYPIPPPARTKCVPYVLYGLPPLHAPCPLAPSSSCYLVSISVLVAPSSPPVSAPPASSSSRLSIRMCIYASYARTGFVLRFPVVLITGYVVRMNSNGTSCIAHQFYVRVCTIFACSQPRCSGISRQVGVMPARPDKCGKDKLPSRDRARSVSAARARCSAMRARNGDATRRSAPRARARCGRRR